MKRASGYSRVSTEDQEREGTSLDSQQAACVSKAKELGYPISDDHVIKEVWSGLTLDRPKLTELRAWVRGKEIDAVIVYSTDRLSRDPVHLLVLAEEFEKAGVELIFVTDPLDNSPEGQLLSFVKGWASKVEAFKIRERTLRGKRTRNLQGRIASGSHARLYGYHYIKVKAEGGGKRIVNEDEARWVRQIYQWFVEDGLSIDAITYKLRGTGVSTPSGTGPWIRSTVHKILSNPAYIGKTYAFTQTYIEPKNRLNNDTKRIKSTMVWRPREDWIEIPNVTPPIITEELYEAAQRQLQRNKELALRNTKREYLLHGLIKCGHCGRTYWGKTNTTYRGAKHYERSLYRCSGSLKKVSEVLCSNPTYNARQLENVVWEQVEALLYQPELVLRELTKRKEETGQAEGMEDELSVIDTRLKNLKKRDERLFRGWLWGQDEELIEKEKRGLDKEKEVLEAERQRLLERINMSREINVDSLRVEQVCELLRNNLKTLTFEEKRFILETLLIKVWVSDNGIKIEGCIPLPSPDIVSTPSGWRCRAGWKA
ncbi:recombinase family protein [Chloroflexota bacterium]